MEILRVLLMGFAILIGVILIIPLFTKKSIFQRINGFDEAFWVSGEDQDLQCKVWDAGYDIYATEKIFFEHIGKATSRNLENQEHIWKENFLKFREKWKHRLVQSNGKTIQS